MTASINLCTAPERPLPRLRRRSAFPRTLPYQLYVHYRRERWNSWSLSGFARDRYGLEKAPVYPASPSVAVRGAVRKRVLLIFYEFPAGPQARADRPRNPESPLAALQKPGVPPPPRPTINEVPLTPRPVETL